MENKAFLYLEKEIRFLKKIQINTEKYKGNITIVLASRGNHFNMLVHILSDICVFMHMCLCVLAPRFYCGKIHVIDHFNFYYFNFQILNLCTVLVLPEKLNTLLSLHKNERKK